MLLLLLATIILRLAEVRLANILSMKEMNSRDSYWRVNQPENPMAGFEANIELAEDHGSALLTEMEQNERFLQEFEMYPEMRKHEKVHKDKKKKGSRHKATSNDNAQKTLRGL